MSGIELVGMAEGEETNRNESRSGTMSANENPNGQLAALIEEVRTAATIGQRREVINEIVTIVGPLIKRWRRALVRKAPLLEWDDLESTAILGILEALHERAVAGAGAGEIRNPAGWLFAIAVASVIGFDSSPAGNGGVASPTRIRKQRFAAGVVAPQLTQQRNQTPTAKQIAVAADAAWRARRGNAAKAGRITTADLYSPRPKSTDGFEIEDREQLGTLEQLIEAEERFEAPIAAAGLLEAVSLDAEVRDIIRARFGYDPRTGEYSRIDDPMPLRDIGARLGLSKDAVGRRLRAAKALLLDLREWDRELAMAG